MKKWLIIAIAYTHCLLAQSIPDTEIYVFDVKNVDGHYQFTNPTNITNRVGYDNQPSFLRDGASILYTSIRTNDQADIYLYDVTEKTTKQLTNTPESEYSPTLMSDDLSFSVVRVESDGKTQRLWKFPFDGSSPSLILEKTFAVGYHCWYKPSVLALFIVGEDPMHSLSLCYMADNSSKVVAKQIGRSLHRIPNSTTISFVDKSAADWQIKCLEMDTFETSKITNTLPQSEDYTWTAEGKIWMGLGGKLFQFDPHSKQDWQLIADFNDVAITQFTRISLNPQGSKLAIVVHKQE